MTRIRTGLALSLIVLAAIAWQGWSTTPSETPRAEHSAVAQTAPTTAPKQVLASAEQSDAEALVAVEPKRTPDSPEMIRLAEANREKRIVANIERLEASVIAARQAGNPTHEQLLERRIAYLQGELESPTD